MRVNPCQSAEAGTSPYVIDVRKPVCKRPSPNSERSDDALLIETLDLSEETRPALSLRRMG